MKIAVIGMLLSPFLLVGQQNRGAWTNIGPSPAAVRAIAVDPRGTGTIFMGAITGGVRKSIDHGKTWSAANTGLTNLKVQGLAIDASGPQTVYAGTAAGSLFKTDDGGGTWRNISGMSGVGSVAADPNRSGVVYAAVFNSLANGSVMKTIDGGVTWSTVLPGTAGIFTIRIDPGNSDVLYAATVGRGAFKSTDSGEHWSRMSALTPEAIWTLVLDPANSQIVYAGTNQDGVWKSIDAGSTWQQVGSPGPFPVYSLAVEPSVAHTIYAGTNGGGVWTSPDAGVTWQSTGLSKGLVSSLAVDSGGLLFAGTNAAGAQISRDLGATWSVLDAGIEDANKDGYGVWIDPSNGKKLLVSSEFGYGMVGSQDGGASWSDVGQGFTGYGSRSVAFDPSDSQRIYAGGTIGNVFFKSMDGGLTWSIRRFGTAAAYVIAVAVDPLSPNTVYVGTQNEGVFKSTDYGDTWKSTASRPAGAITFLTLDPAKNGRLFASTSTAFYLSEDSGETWTNVLNVPAWTVTIDPNRPLQVYATARTRGVFRSFDGGHTWQGINGGLTSLSMGRSAPVIVDPRNPQTLYVGSSGGVFKSLDGGDHWFAVNSGLDELDVNGLAMDPTNPAVLYVCGPHGVYKTVTGAEIQSAPTISAVLNGASNLPGPVSPGEIVIITGSGLGPGPLIPASPGADGLYNAQLSGTTVQFNGTPAPVIYTSAAQVAVQVPNSIPFGRTQVTVAYEGRTSAAFLVQIVQYAPGVFTLDSTGRGPAVVVNQDGAMNSTSKPARVGDVVSIYATGFAQDAPVTVTIGGQVATVSSVKNTAGVARIAVRVPAVIQSGVLPVVVIANQSLSQFGVTIVVQSANPTAAASDLPVGWATAVTADAAGNVYFISLNSVFKVDPRGVLPRVAGNLQPGYSGDGGPAIDARLFTDDLENETPAFGVPSGLAVDLKGNLYISDGGNARVRRVSADGVITTVAGNGTRGYSGDGGPATAAQLTSPHGLAVDSAGDLYIADAAAVRKVSTTGTISTAAVLRAIGVTVDNSGNLYVADYTSVRRVSPDGSITTVAGGTGIIGQGADGGLATNSPFIGPMTVALDRDGNLYIGDVRRVRKVSIDGIINTVAGGGKDDPGDGGPAIQAHVEVLSIATDNSGNLYIAGYRRVRKVSADGIVTTIAGNGN